MPTFRYTAKGEDGKPVKGTIDSASKESALDALKQLRMEPVEVEPIVIIQSSPEPPAAVMPSVPEPVAPPPPPVAPVPPPAAPVQRALPVRSYSPAARPVTVKAAPTVPPSPDPIAPPTPPKPPSPAEVPVVVTGASSTAKTPAPRNVEEKPDVTSVMQKKKWYAGLLALFRSHKKISAAAPTPPKTEAANIAVNAPAATPVAPVQQKAVEQPVVTASNEQQSPETPVATPSTASTESRPSFFAPKKDGGIKQPAAKAIATSNGSVPTTARRYVPLLSTLRLYAGWLFAWYALVVALGYYVQVRALPFEIPLVYGLSQSSLVEGFLIATFLFLLFSTLHRSIHGGMIKGFVLTVIAIVMFVGIQQSII